jgi:general secretion pathway protein A
MYLEFYGFYEKPFNLTPDAHFLYPSKNHRDALVHLMFGIENRKGFILLTGEVGSGKTTLCRTLVNQIKDNTEVALVLNSFLNELELLKTINEDLGIQTVGKTKKELIDELNEFLLACRAKDRNVVIIVDEAQNMAMPVLEEVRMLSNLETEKEKLVQIVLVGQPELKKTLDKQELRQLNQRITVRYHLKALKQNDIANYIQHRLRVAGSTGDILFTKGAIKSIHRNSGGVPRLINAICDHCLLVGFTRSTRTISSNIVRKAISELYLKQRVTKTESNVSGRWKTGVAIGVAAAFILGMGLAAKFAIDSGKFNIRVGGKPQTPGALQTAVSREETVKTPAVSGKSSIPVPIGEQELADLAGPSHPSLTMAALDTQKAGLLGKLLKTDPKEEEKQESLPPKSMVVEDLLRVWSTPRNDITRVLNAVGEHFDPDTDLIHIYENARVGCVQTQCNLDFLMEMNSPAIIELMTPDTNSSEYVLLLAIEGEQATIFTPQHKITAGLNKLKELFTGRAVFVSDNTFINPLMLHKDSGVGLEVRKLQELLKKYDIYDGNMNGWYSDDVKKAVRKFQKKHELPVTGIVDVKTKLKLYFLLPDTNRPRLQLGG